MIPESMQKPAVEINTEAALLSPLDRPSPKKYLFVGCVVALVWVLFAWIESSGQVDSRLSQALADAKRRLAEDVAEISSGIGRALTVYHGIPAIIARDRTIVDALSRFPPTAPPAALAREAIQEKWHHDPVLAHLNQLLADSVQDVAAFSAVWVVNAAGDCVAASNSDTRESFVGANFADRDYFKAGREGRQGSQFAVGRISGIPGLFFSAPVHVHGVFYGVVAVKIELPFLSNWINQSNAFLTDPYGVVILSRSKELEMMTMPGGRVVQLTKEQRKARYRKEIIPELPIIPWSAQQHTELVRLPGQKDAFLLASQEIPGEDLTLKVLQPVPQVATHDEDHVTQFVAFASSGLIVVTLLTVASFYLVNWQRVRRYEAQRRQINYLATHDTLTGLFSRAMIDHVVPHSIALAARTARAMAIMFVDLDLFKNINDSLGHESGDEVLREVAQRLRRAVRTADAVIRQGGDEFIVVLNDLGHTDDAARIARKLIQEVQQPFTLKGVDLNLSASVGIAMYPNDGDSPSMLLRNADSALYNAKNNGRADFHFYHASMNADSLARLSVESALRQGIERGELVLYFQPQFELGSHRILGCEALVRWNHPTQGLVAPDAFIPIAEKSGLILAVDDWVLRESCRQMQDWRCRSGYDMQIAVNISAVHFRREGLVERVKHALDASGLPPQHLELELTESAIMENAERAATVLGVLRGLGVRIAIDDFGTGYSSLAYLKRFEADVIKIDRFFVKQLDADMNDQAIVRAIIQMAKSMGSVVIAEGIETEACAALLHRLGCARGQGFWMSKPLSVDVFAAFVAGESAGLRNA